jgi:23S rRNA pseudouridine1911/1915/1917 synthase
MRLDSWLSIQGGFSRAEVQRLIEAGSVTLDGKPARKSSRVSEDQQVEVSDLDRKRLDTKGEPAGFEVRYEDEHLAVVSKPAGVVVHPAGVPKGNTLVEALAERMSLAPAGGEIRPGIVHRLDKDTSGLLVVAKTDESYRALVDAIRKREVTRIYMALVLGRFDVTTGRIEAPIGRSRRTPILMAVAGAGRDAATEFRVVEQPGDLSLLEVTLVTGRTHQIRVHLSHIQRPVVGDRTYGRAADNYAKAIHLNRPFLHAHKLKFLHPISAKELLVSDPLPQDLSIALEFARSLAR